MFEQLVLSWIALALALVSFCASIYAIIKLHSDSDVGELARHVTALRKSHRQEQMRRVREEAVAAREVSAPLGPDGKPFPFGPLGMPTSEHFPETNKQQLRRRVFGARLLSKSGTTPSGGDQA